MADRRRLPRPRGTNWVDRNCRPWCRENLRKNRPPSPTFMNTKQWVFLRDGLDDFRYGCPPSEGMITRGLQEHSIPQTSHHVPRPPPPRRQIKRPKGVDLCSKLSPAQQERKAFLIDTEAQLKQHPLAHYSNLGEDMPAEVSSKVLKVLDPDRKLVNTWAHCEDTRKKTKKPIKCFRECSTQDHPELPKKTRLVHPDPLLYEEKKPSEMNSLHEDGSVLYENARKAVSDFCKWASDIGSAKIDEEFVMKQFEVDYQSKTSCYGRYTMKHEVFPELRKSFGPNRGQEAEFFQKRERKPENPSKPKYVKMRYGAWYLNPKLWKRQRADEPLVDPRVLYKAQQEKIKKELQAQEEFITFSELYGPVAFKEFILRKGYRMPSFLEKINVKKECKYEYKKNSMK